MINTLKVVSAGYLKITTKSVLIIAVAGYLNFGSTPPPVPPSQSGDGFHGGGGSYYDREQKENEERLKRQVREEDEIIELVLQSFLKIIN